MMIFTSLVAWFPLPGNFLAAFPEGARFLNEAGLVAAVVLTIVGIILQWQLPRQRMTAEERMKDGRMTETEANRRITFFRHASTVVTGLGVILLILALVDFSR